MDLHESSRGYVKRDVEKSSDMKVNRVGDDEDSDGNDKRKYRSSKARKHASVDEAEKWDSSERRRSSGDRLESRKRSSGTSRIGSGDEDEYDTKRDLRLKQIKKSQEENSEKKLSSGYQEREAESNRKGRDASGTKGHGAADVSEKELSRKSGSKLLVDESSQSKSRSRANNSHDIEQEKIEDRDFRYTERKESSRDRGHTSRETEKNLRRRLDESDSYRKGEESYYGDRLDPRSGKFSEKHGKVHERTSDVRNEPMETKLRDWDPNSDKDIKFDNREEKKIDGEKIRSRGRPMVHEEDYMLGSLSREERSSGPRDDKLRMIKDKPSAFPGDTESVAHRPSIRSHGEKIEIHTSETRERPINTDENGQGHLRDRSGGEVRHYKMPWSPERPGRQHPQSGDSNSDNERNILLKEKERETETYRDDRSKGRDSNWSDRLKDHEGSRDNWRRRHETNSDKDGTYVVVDYDRNIEWDAQRQGRDRNDNNKLHNYPSYRKIGRNDGAKSGYGSANRSSDMIEIRPKPMDYSRDESGDVFTARENEGGPQTDYASTTGDDRTRMADIHGPGDDLKDRYPDDSSSVQDQNSGRSNMDLHGENLRGPNDFATSNRSGSGPNLSSGSQIQSGNFNRITPQGAKGGRLVRGGRGRLPGREGQWSGIQLPMVGSPFGPPVFPPGPMQTLGPNMSPVPGPPMGPGVFIPPFPGPNIWPGARGVDMNMLSVPHGLSVPPGQSQHRFPPNVVAGPNPNMYYNQQGSARGVSPNISGPGFNNVGAMGRGFPNDKALGGWNPKTSGPPGKAPSRGEQNDYSQNFVDTGMRPQNYIRELLELTNSVEDYPKLRELIQRKDEIVAKASTPPMYYKCDLRDFVLSSDFFGTKFDVILVDPPWEEYVHRAPGVADQMDYWTFEEISNLKIEAIADTPSFIFLWVGDGVGLEQGRQCLRKWGFRRCEDICWVKTNKSNTSSGLRHDSHTLFQHSKEHCLMGIKGTVRRSTDGHVIHANIDTDIVIAEEPPYGSTKKPEDLYRIIEHFSLGRRRIELFGEDHNIRSGWLTVGKGLSSSNFNAEGYIRSFCDKDGKVWQGGGGRNPPPGAPHLIVTTPEIEGLRPKSPPPKNQQHQLSVSLPQTTSINSTNRRPGDNSPQNPTSVGLFQEHSGSNPSTPAQWMSSTADLKAPDTVGVITNDKAFDGYSYEPSGVRATGDIPDFASQGASNLM